MAGLQLSVSAVEDCGKVDQNAAGGTHCAATDRDGRSSMDIRRHASRGCLEYIGSELD